MFYCLFYNKCGFVLVFLILSNISKNEFVLKPEIPGKGNAQYPSTSSHKSLVLYLRSVHVYTT